MLWSVTVLSRCTAFRLASPTTVYHFDEKPSMQTGFCGYKTGVHCQHIDLYETNCGMDLKTIDLQLGSPICVVQPPGVRSCNRPMAACDNNSRLFLLGEFLSAFASTACLNAAGNLPRLPSCCSAVDTRLKPNGHSIANPKNALIVNTRTTCSASGNLSPPCPACAKASANDCCISVVEECKYGLCLVYIKLDLGRWR